MYVAVTGEAPVDVKMSDIIMLTFDLVMTEEEFFDGEKLVNNLAIFFGVPQDKVRELLQSAHFNDVRVNLRVCLPFYFSTCLLPSCYLPTQYVPANFIGVFVYTCTNVYKFVYLPLY